MYLRVASDIERTSENVFIGVFLEVRLDRLRNLKSSMGYVSDHDVSTHMMTLGVQSWNQRRPWPSPQPQVPLGLSQIVL